MKKILITSIVLLLVNTCFAQSGFSQKDREILIELKVTIQQLEKRMDEHFEAVDIRFTTMYTFLWIITGIFTVIMATSISLSFRDRKEIAKQSTKKAVETIEKQGLPKKLLEVFRELSKTDKKVAQVLTQFNLL